MYKTKHGISLAILSHSTEACS